MSSLQAARHGRRWCISTHTQTRAQLHSHCHVSRALPALNTRVRLRTRLKLIAARLQNRLLQVMHAACHRQAACRHDTLHDQRNVHLRIPLLLPSHGCSSVYVLLVAHCRKTLLVVMVIDRQLFLSVQCCCSCIPVSNIPIHMVHGCNQPCNAVCGICHLQFAMFVSMTDMQLSV